MTGAASWKRQAALGGLVAAWLLAILVSIGLVERYKTTPGIAANAPENWPAESRIPRGARPTLVMLAHPKCSCTRASISELAELMSRVGGRLDAWVLFLHPEGTPAEWTATDTWRSAEAIPGVHVIVDERGEEARRFGAATSGQTVVYDAAGHLVFSGGITPARGHLGTSVGRDRIAQLFLGDEKSKAPVFGCALGEPTAQEGKGL
jgi:hypothetical protein